MVLTITIQIPTLITLKITYKSEKYYVLTIIFVGGISYNIATHLQVIDLKVIILSEIHFKHKPQYHYFNID